jgi:UDP-glucose:(heptosyl)LPS alpha-1,3-glucosyltransferase
MLIKALAEVKEFDPIPHKCWVFAGDRKASYIRLARRFGLSEEVIFVGSTNEPEKYYGAADILVHPTFYDACSLTVLEALATGLPVITTSSNGASGIITSGQEGFVISGPGTSQNLANQISVLLDREVLAKASTAARRTAENHSLERNWREMKRVLIDPLLDKGV